MWAGREIVPGRHCYLFVYAAVSFLVLLPFLSPGYILTLDMVFGPKIDFEGMFYGLREGISAGLPFFALLWSLSLLFGVEVVQKVFLFLILFFSGVSAHRLTPAESQAGRYFAGFLYMLNPFVYVRFLAGHFLLLLGYAILPFAVKSIMDLLERPLDRKRVLKSVLLISLTGVLAIHTLFLLFFLTATLFLFKLYQEKGDKRKIWGLVKTALFLGALFLAINFYWILPLATSSSTPVGQITRQDLTAFATTQDLRFNVLFTAASMYGFWRGGYLYAKDLLPGWYLLFIFILFLAVHGFSTSQSHRKYGVYVNALAFTAVLSLILASGVSGIFSGVFEFLFNHIFFFKGFREPQKFVALLALAYSYLGSLGVTAIEKTLSTSHRGAGRKIVLLFVVFALATPFIYSFTFFNGFWGQLKPVEYPRDWYSVNEYLKGDSQDFNVLFLPWHLYMDFKWLPNQDKRIATPAYVFFDKPVIQGDNMEVGGIYTSSTNPASRYLESQFLAKKNGSFLTPLNIKYVILAKEVDYQNYLFLFNQTDLQLVLDTENLYLFRNLQPTSRFYQSDDLTNLTPLNYTRLSPVRYRFERPVKKYIFFIPSNLNSQHWISNGKKPLNSPDFYAVYPADTGGGTVEYQRFNTYLAGYLASILGLLALLLWTNWRKTKKKERGLK